MDRCACGHGRATHGLGNGLCTAHCYCDAFALHSKAPTGEPASARERLADEIAKELWTLGLIEVTGGVISAVRMAVGNVLARAALEPERRADR